MTQVMTTKAQAVTTQDQGMRTQENRVVPPRSNQNANTMASCLRDFNMMNPAMFFRSKVTEDPQDILDEVYKIMYAIGVRSNEMVKLVSYCLEDMAKTWYTQ